ncbi:alpha/beta fold hydrolase [Microvirga pakistanensis]|uniref:alpha/beta fold hydrolase n=1 Tax=Microvirga pakistanensis TaxID=1682650 RepID=UPI00106C08C0|nr:alpha/beta hydrolase [Microvirga pakistanensis]
MTITYAPKQTTTRGHTVQINDIEMYYEEYGAGKPLVLLHGFGGSGQNWYPFKDKLAERHRLIVVDLRGHGHSSNPENQFTHREAANDVFLLLEKLRIGHFSAMGISSGAMTLLHMATSQPERIDSMVLISATTHFPDQARVIMRRASFDVMPQQVKEMYRECAKRGDEQIGQLIAQFNALGENHDDMNFTAYELSNITARTLVVHGDRDRFFPIEIPVNIYRSIPNAALWIIPGGEHAPIYDPVVPFTTTALRFLDGSESKSHSAAEQGAPIDRNYAGAP